MNFDLAKLAIDRAVADTRMAYQFNPGSYTYSAHLECLKAKDVVDAIAALILPSWIDEYLDYAGEPECPASP